VLRNVDFGDRVLRQDRLNWTARSLERRFLIPQGRLAHYLVYLQVYKRVLRFHMQQLVDCVVQLRCVLVAVQG
jgi:hypothetical protein